jgi:uncharacterized UPF0160 family protein
MKIFNEENQEITLEDCDLTLGLLSPYLVVKADATPIDNVTKFAWSDDDYEEAQMYIQVYTKKEYCQRQINELKDKLTETDYVVIKIAEGVSDASDYQEVLDNRKEWREKINELEKEVENQ